MNRITFASIFFIIFFAACSLDENPNSTQFPSGHEQASALAEAKETSPTQGTNEAKTGVPSPVFGYRATNQAVETTRQSWTATPEAATVTTPTPQALTDPPGLRIDSIQMIDKSVGWADTSSGDYGANQIQQVWRTTDGGMTWRNVVPASNKVGLIQAISGEAAWIVECQPAERGCHHVLFRMVNGGQTWQELGGDLPLVVASVEFFNELAGVHTTYDVAAGSTYLRFHETQDGGLSWSPIEIQSSHQGDPIESWGYRLCGICGDVYYLDIDRFLVVSGNLSNEAVGRVSLWLTLDQGATWRELEIQAPAGPFEQAWVEPQPPQFLDANHGILPLKLTTQDFNQQALAFYRTMDGGFSWQYRSFVELPQETNTRASVQMPTANNLFFVCGLELCVSHDSGSSWRKLSAPFAWAPNPEAAFVQSFDFVDADNGWALVGEGPDTIWFTSDGGETWRELASQFLGAP